MDPKDVIIGNRYVVVGNTEPEHCFDIGEVVEAIGDYCDDTPEYFKDVDGMCQYMSADDIEPVKDIEPIKASAFDRVEIGDKIVALVPMQDNVGNVIEKGTVLGVRDKDENDLCLLGDHNACGTWFYMTTESNINNQWRPVINDNDSFEILEEAKVSGEVVAKRGKFLYAIQDEDGHTITTTFDRNWAREIKAYEGGKKAGYKIVAYAPIKEIR